MKLIKLIIFDLDGTLTPQRHSSTSKHTEELMPGVKNFFNKYGNKFKFGVLTNQSNNRAHEDIIDHFLYVVKELLIHPGNCLAVFGGDKKPNPLGLKKLSKCFDIDNNIISFNPDEILFVGDQETDKQAADNFGCGFVWASEFFNNPDKFLLDMEMV